MRKMFLLLLALSLSLSVPSLTEASISLGVADFVSRTDMVAAGQLQHITEVFRQVLSSSSETIDVTKSRSLQVFNMTAEDAVSAGKSAGCQYVLLGTVLTSDMNYSNTYGGTPKTITQTQTITIDTRVIDVKTGEIILSASGTGAASFSYDWKKEMAENPYSKKKREESIERYNNMMKGAVSSASSMVAEKVCASLAGEYPEISSIKPNKKSAAKKSGKKDAKANLGSVKVNRGTASGVNKGTLYRIYFEGEEVFDVSGASLGNEKFNVALAEVKEARTNFSTAEVFAGIFKNIRDEDKAEQISQEEAELIIEKDDFARNRLSEFLK